MSTVLSFASPSSPWPSSGAPKSSKRMSQLNRRPKLSHKQGDPTPKAVAAAVTKQSLPAEMSIAPAAAVVMKQEEPLGHDDEPVHSCRRWFMQPRQLERRNSGLMESQRAVASDAGLRRGPRPGNSAIACPRARAPRRRGASGGRVAPVAHDTARALNK